MAIVSSPGGTFDSWLRPSASAAQTSARLAMLFDPGTETTASSGRHAVGSVLLTDPAGAAFRSGG